ncbi:MAG: hypothetical protein ACE5IZ_11710, partial [Dehalococcoidia bacterium]
MLRGHVGDLVRQQRPLPAGLGTALALAALLVAYGNLVSLSPDDVKEKFDWAYRLGNLALMSVLLLWATKAGGLSWAAIGFSRARVLRSACQGGALAAVVSVPVVLYFAFPLVVSGPIEYEPVAGWSIGGFLLWALLKEPVGTALFEETV